MHFTNPYFLFGLFAILIPIIIHLFNFRRYKTAYFSNVKLLQNILLKTKRESQLQHLIVLFFRILGIASLVFAFAQPYIPLNDQQTTNGKLVSVFVDNSYSMEANSQNGSLLQEAVDAAKNIVNAFSYSDDYILITNEFSAKESKILNKDEILVQLDEIGISTNSKSLDEVIAFQDNLAHYSDKKSALHYYISDFQKSQFDFNSFIADSLSRSFLVQMPAKQTRNIAIDTCWFSTPVFTLGQQVTLTVRISNYGENEVMKLPVKLYINGQQRALAAVDLKGGSHADVQMPYNITSAGIQKGVVQIDDAPITFDDDLYFVYEVKESTNVIAIVSKNQNDKYLRALYGKDSLFVYTEMQEDQINYSQFANAQLIVLNQLKSISSGLGDELKKFLKSGGNVLVFPNEELNKEEWNAFLSSIGTSTYNSLAAQQMRVGKINTESFYYKGSLNKMSGEQLDMPQISKYYEFNKTSEKPSEVILALENNSPLLSSYNIEKGKLFLSAIALDDQFGQAHKHALFFIPLHNIGIMSLAHHQLYYRIGIDDMATVNNMSSHSEDLFVVKAEKDGAEFIPEQRGAGTGTILYFRSQVQEPGFYSITKGNELVSLLAFNRSRKESDLDYYTKNELEDIANATGERYLSVLEGNIKNMTDQIANSLNGKPLWRYFICLALLCFLIEIAVLRLWGRAKYREE